MYVSNCCLRVCPDSLTLILCRCLDLWQFWFWKSMDLAWKLHFVDPSLTDAERQWVAISVGGRALVSWSLHTWRRSLLNWMEASTSAWSGERPLTWGWGHAWGQQSFGNSCWLWVSSDARNRAGAHRQQCLWHKSKQSVWASTFSTNLTEWVF